MSVRSFFILTGCLVWTVFTSRAAERGFERTFPVEPGCTLKLDTYRGSVAIVESDVAEIRVTVQVVAGAAGEEAAERAQAEIQFESAEDNNTVTLRARNPAESGVRFVWNDPPQLTLAWRITVPRECNVEIRTRAGGIVVGNLTGHVVAHTETGTISLKRIDGSVEASTRQGDIVLSRCSGPVKLRAVGGTLRTGTLGGFADLKNTNGDVEVLVARAGIVADAEAGDVDVGFPRDLAGDARLNTSGGNIRVTIDPTAACTVTASSVWGRVENTLPMTVDSGASGRSKLSGHLGQGGPTLTFRANGGDVKIAPGETYFE
ncbi:MAG: DUF4097 family beta strand repeat-containing protein [Verrucomicrobia bacterium]|nr:DUF4097 family beta strand repeat-containing protein [Verrucomicrobiota bacterium]